MTDHQHSAAAAYPARPDLWPVHPRGLAQRAAVRREARGLHSAWRLDGWDETTPGRAQLHAGIAYGAWGLDPDAAALLGDIAAEMAAAALGTPRLTLLLALDGTRTTTSVLLTGAHQAPDPGYLPVVTAHADHWGRHQLAAGPVAFAALDTARRPA
ncbi:hypothetical protein ACFYNY_34450 [Streptomyces sp. NPDC006530]|uniref:hypothetical protein n=1 Tax=Streptomyces sp. NPDC006530 TaxID=3364750 RepID=UPI0036896890